MALGKRVKLARTARGLTQQQLADLIDWDQAAIGNMESRDSKTSRYTHEIAVALDVSLEWLSSGTGEMEKSGSEAYLVKAKPLDSLTKIPQFTNVALSAGAGVCPPDFECADSFTYMDTDRIRMAGADPECVIEAVLDGRSMEPTIMDKSPVRIDTSKAHMPIKDGKIYAFRVNDDLKIKRLFTTATGDVRITSDNELYKDEFLSISDFNDRVQIIGWVFDWPPMERW